MTTDATKTHESNSDQGHSKEHDDDVPHDHDENKNHHDKHGHHDDHDDHGPMSLYAPPQQRQRWGERQLPPHTEWGDIFFDLLYVASAYNLGNLLREDPTARGLLYLVGCFLPIMGLWLFKTYYDSRYYVTDDLFHRVYEVATLVPLATAVLHIRTVPLLSDPTQNIDMFAFCLSLSIGYALSLGRLVEIMICQKWFQTPGLYTESFYAVRKDLPLTLISFGFYLAATIYTGVVYYGDNDDSSTDSKAYDTGDDHRRFLAGDEKATSKPEEDDVAIWLCLVGHAANLVATGLVFLCLKNHKEYTVPMNINYSIHRFGEWTMLLLGESVLSLLIVDLSEGYEYYKTFYSGVVTVILLEFLHFRSQPHEPDKHAMRRSKSSAYCFYSLYQVYSVALIILGTCYKMFLLEFEYADSEEAAAKEEDDHRRMAVSSPIMAALSSVSERWLAGGESSALRFDTDDRHQRIAHFFSASLALVWFCLDVMILTHLGLDANMHRCQCQNQKKIKFWIVVMVVLRVSLIGFVATLSQYVTDPTTLAFMGLAGTFGQLLLRALGTIAFPPDKEEQEDEAIDRMANYFSARVRESS